MDEAMMDFLKVTLLFCGIPVIIGLCAFALVAMTKGMNSLTDKKRDI